MCACGWDLEIIICPIGLLEKNDVSMYIYLRLPKKFFFLSIVGSFLTLRVLGKNYPFVQKWKYYVGDGTKFEDKIIHKTHPS